MRPQDPDLKLPSDLYRWRGLDGSEVGALRIEVGLYHTERHNLRQRLEEGAALALRLDRDVPVFWGLGDHGGGPTRADLRIIEEFALEEQRVEVRHSTTEQLYQALKPRLDDAPRVEGELGRVFTGCYTSLSRLKREAAGEHRAVGPSRGLADSHVVAARPTVSRRVASTLPGASTCSMISTTFSPVLARNRPSRMPCTCTVKSTTRCAACAWPQPPPSTRGRPDRSIFP